MKKSFTTTLRSLFRTWSYTLILLCSIPVWPVQPVAAEGSRDLFPSTAQTYRANLEWYTQTTDLTNNNSYGPKTSVTPKGLLIRRTLLKVYAEQGEYILTGSSAVGVSNTYNGVAATGDVLIYDNKLVTGTIGQEALPATSLFSCLQQRTQTGNMAQGQIGSRTQELAGPDTIADETTGARGNAIAAGYVPCFYKAPATGIYDVVMYGPSGTALDTNTPSGLLESPANFDGRQKNTVAAWDVTVRSSLTSPIDVVGRLFTYYLSMFTGSNGRPISSTIYMVTNDGFQYKLNLNGMDPNGFISYGNMRGFLDTDGSLLYHDVVTKVFTNTNVITPSTQDQNQLSYLNGDVSLAVPEYPLFFNQPDPKALTALGLPPAPVLPKITAFTFSSKSGSSNEIQLGEGGTFSITSDITTVFDLVLSHDRKDFNPDEPLNRVFHNVIIGRNVTKTLKWDGNNNAGSSFTKDGKEGDIYVARVTFHGGELHFPFLDVENSPKGGPRIQMLNAPDPKCAPLRYGCTTAFYDDDSYTTVNSTLVTTGCPGSPGNPPKLLSSDPTGFDTASTQRAFGFNTTTNRGNPTSLCGKAQDPGGFGDKKGLDLWTYFPGDKRELRLTIVSGITAIDLTSFSAYAQQNAVTVQWQTSAEINTMGFQLYRSSDGTRANAVRVTPQLVLAKGRGQNGANYTWTDASVQAGHRYAYWLEEVEIDGSTHEYGPTTAAFAGAAAGSFIYLPLLR